MMAIKEDAYKREVTLNERTYENLEKVREKAKEIQSLAESQAAELAQQMEQQKQTEQQLQQTKQQLGELVAKSESLRRQMQYNLAAKDKTIADLRHRIDEIRPGMQERYTLVSEELASATEKGNSKQAETERLRANVKKLKNDLALSQAQEGKNEQADWKIESGEVYMTREILGGGAYGEVRVAQFRGTKVAAKCLHHIIISSYNVKIFSREMRIAAKVRHPNLVQFIGATVDRNPIILMELMSTSLHAELSKGVHLTREQILSISTDVACALNYLHLCKPSPILHRDVSSPNVLLDPFTPGTWKAKLSDYGTANTINKISSKTSFGNPAYCAPEASDPHLQSPKMDTHSFGVLMLEMALCKLPDQQERTSQVACLKWIPMRDFIMMCTAEDRERRPSMTNVLKHLSHIRVLL